MLSVKNLRKVYRSKKAEEVVALNNVSIDFPETGFVFLLGKSGSGKSTLLNAIGGLDKFDGGEIIIKGKSSADFTQADFDSYRNTFIGFIFQEYNYHLKFCCTQTKYLSRVCAFGLVFLLCVCVCVCLYVCSCTHAHSASC